MKFTCDKASILREVSVAQDIISSRNALFDFIQCSH